MKILYLSSYSNISLGGDSRVAWELARYISTTNNDVYMLCPNTSFSYFSDSIEKKLMVYTYPSKEISNSFKIFRISLKNVRRLYSLLDDLSPEVIHAHDFMPVSFLVQNWALKNKVPFVYTGHILPSSFIHYSGFKWAETFLQSLGVLVDIYTRCFYKFCSKVIALNRYAEEDFRKYCKNNVSTTIIPNGRNLSEYKYSERGLNSSPTYNLMFAGNISKRKNQEYIVNAMQYLNVNRPTVLYLVGEVVEKECMRSINKVLPKLKNVEVKFLGHLEHMKVAELYRDMHFLLSASKKEVQSLVILESLASGTPVIGLANETTKEFVKDGLNGFILDIDTPVKTFAQKTEEALSLEEDKYIRMRQESRKTVEHLDWANVSVMTLKHYAEIVSEYKSLKSNMTRAILTILIFKASILFIFVLSVVRIFNKKAIAKYF